jgi:hypothetical protein
VEPRAELIDDFMAAGHLGHVSCLHKPVVRPEGVRRLLSSRRHAYPDLYVKIEDQQDDLVATRRRAIASTPETRETTGCLRCWSGISIIRLLAGKQIDTYTALAPSATDGAA